MIGVLRLLMVLVVLATTPTVLSAEQKATPEQLEFFESRIRPVLVEHCQSCHNSIDSAEGSLVLDYRGGLRRGGQSGKLLNLKQPEKSLLLKVLRHELLGLEMPQDEDRLSTTVIADFEKWIRDGAIDPRLEKPTSADGGVETWQDTLTKRKEWWSFLPIENQTPPTVANEAWSDHPIDEFILAKLEQQGLQPVEPADRRTLIRRLSIVLRGLPPTSEEIARFLNDESPQAYEQLVDRFLAAPEFGEHWARHWMDLVRYAETHGSEGDPAIPHAWKYRDYLIRAFNNDVPYDQLIREQIAGDLMREPRINAELNLNESAVGSAQWRMCFHGFAPTDALDEKVRFTDDQINVFSKAFLGLTVSCARCHNHKFDPISQADYYACFGILGSTRPGIIDVNLPEIQTAHQNELRQIKTEIQQLLAEQWTQSMPRFVEQLPALVANTPEEELQSAEHWLHPFWLLKNKPKVLPQVINRPQNKENYDAAIAHWDLSNPKDPATWFVHGNGTATAPVNGGDFVIPDKGEAIGELLPPGIYSHLLSTKHRNIVSSPNLELKADSELWVQIAGEGQAMVRYVVQNYPRSGTVYPVRTLTDGQWTWQRFDLTYWTGDTIHVEINTAADSAILAKEIDRSWFGVRNVVLAPKGKFQPPAKLHPYDALSSKSMIPPPGDTVELVNMYHTAVQNSLAKWSSQKLSIEGALFLQAARSAGLLSLSSDSQERLNMLLQKYRSIESKIAVPNRVPGLLEADHADQPLFVRGNHKQPSAAIPRRFLEAIDDASYQPEDSGRLDLAEDMVRRDNPLTSRVAVNRIWHYLFGAGLVRTVDNFGQLGETPSHPELLDYLASRFQQQGWSIKSLIRELLQTKTWQLSATPSANAKTVDPDNRLLSHANVRRLEAEVLRDTLLAISGRLDQKMYGPPVGNATNSPRRSLYLSVRRNSMNPFLETFDFPVPSAPKGRRDVTNVPAQSLTMLNDEFIVTSAAAFIKQIPALPDSAQRIVQLYETALGRSPTPQEVQTSTEFLNQLQSNYAQLRRQRVGILRESNSQQTHIDSILKPVREQLLKQRQNNNAANTAVVPPIAEWRFEDSLEDEIGELHATPHAGARIENGALILDGQGYVSTSPLKKDLRQKTLEVIVQLSNDQQRGGGVMTVQGLDGVVFDSIVFAEQQSRHWLAGSNVFARTLPFQGTDETEAVDQPVHIAITYAADGTIRAFRNGEPYGKAIRKSDLVTFPAGQSQILFGLRHGRGPGGNRMLKGKIFEARLYDRKLEPDEVHAIATGNRSFISEKEVLAALSEQQLQQLDQAKNSQKDLKTALEELGAEVPDDQEWVDLAHAIFNLKEFLYYK